MRNDQIQEYLKEFSPESEIRILVNGVYYNVTAVRKGRFLHTVELSVPEKMSIVTAESELISGLYSGNLSESKQAEIEDVIGVDRVLLLKREMEQAKAQQAEEEKKLQDAVSNLSSGFVDEDLEEEIEEPKFTEKQIKRMSKETKLLNHFKGDLKLSVDEVAKLRHSLGAEKVREIFNKANN